MLLIYQTSDFSVVTDQCKHKVLIAIQFCIDCVCVLPIIDIENETKIKKNACSLLAVLAIDIIAYRCVGKKTF